MHSKIIFAVIVALVCSGKLITHAAEAAWRFEESFASGRDGTTLADLSGWSLHYGEGSSPLVLIAAGHEGLGTRFSSKVSFKRAIESAPVVGQQGPVLEFRFKLRVMADSDAYIMSQIMLGQSGGINGLSVRFNGGTKDGWEDNFIQTSAGGSNWGKARFQTVAGSRWHKNIWYEVIITNIRPGGSGEGYPIASLSIAELDTSGAVGKLLVQNVPVGRIGTGAFDKTDVLIAGNAGSARTFDVDDFILKTISH